MTRRPGEVIKWQKKQYGTNEREKVYRPDKKLRRYSIQEEFCLILSGIIPSNYSVCGPLKLNIVQFETTICYCNQSALHLTEITESCANPKAVLLTKTILPETSVILL